MIIAQVNDFHEAARRRLPRFLLEYMDGGAYAEVTLRRNIADLAGIALRQRALENVVTQIQHLQTHPSIAAALAHGEVSLHGRFFEIDSDAIVALDGQERRICREPKCS